VILTLILLTVITDKVAASPPRMGERFKHE